jgi:hypothetical protein
VVARRPWAGEQTVRSKCDRQERLELADLGRSAGSGFGTPGAPTEVNRRFAGLFGSLAEGEGFEPSKRHTTLNGFRTALRAGATPEVCDRTGDPLRPSCDPNARARCMDLRGHAALGLELHGLAWRCEGVD